MEPELAARLDALEAKVDVAVREATLARRYLMWSFIVGLVTFALPLVGLAIALPLVWNTVLGAGLL
jgi:hypothetical protein